MPAAILLQFAYTFLALVGYTAFRVCKRWDWGKVGTFKEKPVFGILLIEAIEASAAHNQNIFLSHRF